MKLNVTITDNDYIKFHEYMMGRQGYGKQMMNLYKYIIPVIALVIIGLHLISGVNIRLIIVEIILLGILSGVWMTFSSKLYQRNMRRNIKAIRKSGRLPYHEQAEIEWADDAVVERTEDSVISIPYEEITSIDETEDYWYLFYGASQALILPKRDIRQQLPELEQALRGRKEEL